MNLDTAFINENGVIELPGPFYEKLKGMKMSFTENLLAGLSCLLPRIKSYKLTIYKSELRINYKDAPEDIKTCIQDLEGWTIDSSKKVIGFKMTE